MENESKPKKRTRHPDRVSLTPESLMRLASWTTELGERLKGNRISRNDLVNFLILSHSEHLSEREVAELTSQHFDEVRFAEWAVRQIKEARAKGKSISLSEIVQNMGTAKQKGGNDANATGKPGK